MVKRGGVGFGDERGGRPGVGKFKLSGDFPTKISVGLCSSVVCLYLRTWPFYDKSTPREKGARIHDGGDSRGHG